MKVILYPVLLMLFNLSHLGAIAIVANVAQILVDVELRQLYNSIDNNQRIIFGLQKEGNFALF